MTNQDSTNSAIHKALAVLETITQDLRPLGIVDIAHELNLPRQTVHRVVRQLEDLGLLQRDATRERYYAGERLRTLALNTISSALTTRGTHAILEKLVAEIKETCNVGMLDGQQIIYVDRAECDWPLRVQLKAGSHVPVHCTAIGKLLLAHLEHDQRQLILQSASLRKFTKFTLTEPELLEAQFDQIVAQGYSINNQEDSIGLVALAVPVRDPGGEIVAGLGVHAPVPRYSIDNAIDDLPKLHDAAARIGEAMFANHQMPLSKIET